MKEFKAILKVKKTPEGYLVSLTSEDPCLDSRGLTDDILVRAPGIVKQFFTLFKDKINLESLEQST